MSTGGDTALGGDDFDNKIIEFMFTQNQFGGELSATSLRKLAD